MEQLIVKFLSGGTLDGTAVAIFICLLLCLSTFTKVLRHLVDKHEKTVGKIVEGHNRTTEAYNKTSESIVRKIDKLERTVYENKPNCGS